jgi:gluconolactonase
MLMIAARLRIILAVTAILNAASAQGASVIAPGAQVVKLAGGFGFTEGPAADAQGNVFFTDQPNDRICKWSVIDGSVTDFMKPCGRSNGMFFDKYGNLWACADMNNELWMIDPNGTVTVIVKDPDGKKLNGPNDLWIAPNGAIYFTDPLYPRSYWTPGPVTRQDGQYVHYLSPDRSTFMRVATDLVQPNGIIGTPDGKTLYVADYGGRRTYVYKINEDGTLSDKQFFAPQGSDGMTIDCEGNVYLTSGAFVTVYAATGRKLQDIRIPESPANVTFGGADNKTLFITARTSLYALDMAVKGATTPVQQGTKPAEDQPAQDAPASN